MPLLSCWRRDNHRRDLDEGLAYHLNQSNPALHDIGPGESPWAFTRRDDGTCAMAAELVVQTRAHDPPGHRHEPVRVYGDRDRSRTFALEGQPAIEPLVGALSIPCRAGVLDHHLWTT